MKRLAEILFALLATVAIYFGACLLWLAGRWTAIVRPRWPLSEVQMAFLPPLVLPLVFLAWFALRHKRKGAATRRRFIQFGIVVAVSMIVSTVQFHLDAGKGATAPSMTVPATLAFVLMSLVALLALALDRDVELSLRLFLITLVTVIPLVAIGRTLSDAALLPILSAFRSIFGSAS